MRVFFLIIAIINSALSLRGQNNFFRKYTSEGFGAETYLKYYEKRVYAGFQMGGSGDIMTVINPLDGEVLQSSFPAIDTSSPLKIGQTLLYDLKGCIAQDKIFHPAIYYYHGTNSLYTSGMFCYDTSGNFIKAKEILFSYPSFFKKIEPSIDGNLYAIGSLATDTLAEELVRTGLICKLDTAGNKLWEYWRAGPYANLLGGIVAMPDSGMATVVTAGGWPGANRAYLLRLSKTGQKIWEKPLPLPTGLWNGAELIDYDEKNAEFLVFQDYAYSNSQVDTQYLIKVDTNMNIKWQWVYRTKSSSVGFNALGKIVTDGRGYIAPGSGIELTGTMSMGILKFDEYGNKIWTAVYESRKKGGRIDSCYSVIVSSIVSIPEGGYILAGSLLLDSIVSNNTITFMMRIDSNGCFSNDSCESKEWNAVITYYASPKPKVSMFPNPVADALSISIEGLNNFDDIEIKIYDVLGKQAATYTLLQPETKLPLQQLPSGMYMYSIEQLGAVLQNGKMVKE